jgi:predicted metal-binding protein
VQDALIEMALEVGKGAVDAVLIPPEEIEVIDKLAAICYDPGCHNYGASPGCPPNVEGPEAFRKWLKASKKALFIKIEVPLESLLSFEYRDIMRLLHEMVADIEQTLVQAGYKNSKGFAGGSCKELFCRSYTDCNVLERHGSCRNPGRSRPSMSGFGVNVSKLKEMAGWAGNREVEKEQSDGMQLGAVYGLILVA